MQPESEKSPEEAEQPEKPKKQQPAPKLRPGDTANGGMIRDFLKKVKHRGNPKDFVIIVGNRLLDWWGSYDIMFQPEGEDEAKKMGVNGITLLHKKDLYKVLPEDIAAKFWNKKMRMRISPKQPPLRKKDEQAKQR